MRIGRIVSVLSTMMSGDYDSHFGGSLQTTRAMPPVVIPPILETAAATESMAKHGRLRLLSWNLLATPYVRPKEATEVGLARARKQVEYVSNHDADIIALQEFWSHEQQFVQLWGEFASSRGYIMHVCPRVNGKRDGCALLLRAAMLTSSPEFVTYEYDDWGSRVLQLARLEIAGTPLVLMNTHLTFPHDNEHDPCMRRHQARKLSELTRQQQAPTVVVGDLNAGDECDAALGVLTSLGGLRLMPPPAESTGSDGAWFSHVAHTGALMACDMALTRGACHVGEWTLGGNHDDLIARRMTSDHRPLHATVHVGEAEDTIGDSLPGAL